jgi:hypothetical protein
MNCTDGLIRFTPAILVVLVMLGGCFHEARWIGSYSVIVRIRPSEHRAITGVVLETLNRRDFDNAAARLGAPLANSPRYFELFEMSTRQPTPLPKNGDIEVSVRTSGVDCSFPWPRTVSHHRQEKLAVGVYYPDGSRDCFIFDIPAPDQPREVIAEIPAVKGESSVEADLR